MTGRPGRLALVNCDFFSETLEVGTSMTVILPQQTADADRGRGRPRPDGLLYLLHGLSDDHTVWLRRTSIERYAAARGLAVVMPAVHRRFYADERHGHPYWTFVSEELPRGGAVVLPGLRRPADTFVAGLSMGGYGALKWGCASPLGFAAVGQPVRGRSTCARWRPPERADLVERVFGGALRPPTDDLFALLAARRPGVAAAAARRVRHRGGPAAGAEQPAGRRRARPRRHGDRRTSGPACTSGGSGTTRSRT